MNTDAEAKDTKYKTDKEKVSETSKGADKETRKEADTPVKETGSEKESAGRSPIPPVNTEDNLELHSLPFRERQHARRQRLKDTRCMHCPSCYNLQEKPSGCFILLYRQFTGAFCGRHVLCR